MSPLKSYRYLVSQNKLISPDPIKYFHHRIYTTDFATPIILKEKYYVKAFGVVGVILRLKCFAGSGSMQAIFKWKTLHKCYLPPSAANPFQSSLCSVDSTLQKHWLQNST